MKLSNNFDFCSFVVKDNYAILVGSIIILSYPIYRITRTLKALFSAIFFYCILPIVYRPSLEKYKKRWTVVTGATDGIGRAYTLELAKQGIRKFFLIGRNADKLKSIKSELESVSTDCEVQTFVFDFFDGDFALLRKALTNVDVSLAVNSVGIGRELLERYGDNPTSDTQLLRVNGLGAAEFLSCILPPMERHGGGQIVVLSSSQGIRPIPMLAAYSATKSLMSFLCEAIDREYSTISVQCLTPALVATKMTYYKNGSLFVVTAEKFAKEAVSILGVLQTTSGCFNHEIQLLLQHLFPWSILKYLIMPIYWRQQNRMRNLQSNIYARENNKQNITCTISNNDSTKTLTTKKVFSSPASTLIRHRA